jgi:2-keto-4-pentenoate hydratase/2-oxohepta-3-ene-1,7-dioic acid hydratase in catechol pathway
MIFNIPKIVSYISHFLVLEPGDVITTGTPPGVGMGMKPPKFLKAGDIMELGIDGLGKQRQEVIAWSKAAA